MQTNVKVDGLISTFQVYIVHFLVFWEPGKFALKTGTGVDLKYHPLHLQILLAHL